MRARLRASVRAYVRVYVYLYARVCVYVCAYVRACLSACSRVYVVHVNLYTLTHVCALGIVRVTTASDSVRVCPLARPI